MADEFEDPVTNSSSLSGRIFNRKFLGILALGQLLSWLVCGTGIFSQLLVTNYGIEIPTSQSFLNYLLLGLAYTTALSCRPRDFIVTLKERGWKYFILALFDVEANFLVVKAYQYTNLTSVQVLDCFTTASVLALSWLFLKVRYQCLHYLGVAICLIGIACLVIADYFGSRNYGSGKNQAIGDVLVLCGAIMYGISNVAQEFIVKNFSRTEFLGMIGLFGTIISAVQMIILERHQLSALLQYPYQVDNIVLYIVGFGVCLFILYNLMPIAMQFSSATLVNLSLMTADFYSLLCGLLLFHYKFSALYLGSFAFVIIGVIVYNLKPTPTRSSSSVSTHSSMSYRQLEEDSQQSDVHSSLSSLQDSVTAICCQESRSVSE
ncbi:solute carrier family 35 member F1-like [Montipora foliosa]|uniref:solute carrier family 35 member F1-like n=1 Tax=Montipora foliosa TaxID=591990 RepID=UPI0035F1FBDD